MENFIRIYENVVPDNWCDALVQKFEDFEEHHEVVDNKMSFTQINFGRDSLWKYESDYLEKIILEQVERYREDVKIEKTDPSLEGDELDDDLEDGLVIVILIFCPTTSISSCFTLEYR